MDKAYDLTKEEAQALIRAAFEVLPQAYVPYSHFHVGAALLCADGTVYTGVNIENASYPATNCAERTAIFKAVSEGKRDFKAIAVCGGRMGRRRISARPAGSAARSCGNSAVRKRLRFFWQNRVRSTGK